MRDLPQDSNDEAIARAVVVLAMTLQLKVIAEGVETYEQKDFLLEQDCDEAQGFLFSKPVAPDELVKLVVH